MLEEAAKCGIFSRVASSPGFVISCVGAHMVIGTCRWHLSSVSVLARAKFTERRPRICMLLLKVWLTVLFCIRAVFGSIVRALLWI